MASFQSDDEELFFFIPSLYTFPHLGFYIPQNGSGEQKEKHRRCLRPIGLICEDGDSLHCLVLSAKKLSVSGIHLVYITAAAGALAFIIVINPERADCLAVGVGLS